MSMAVYNISMSLVVTDTRIDWQMFNIIPNDTQLVDLVLSYGETFPKKDSEGNVIASAPVVQGWYV